jgi:trimeric autotransporter adhesin
LVDGLGIDAGALSGIALLLGLIAMAILGTLNSTKRRRRFAALLAMCSLVGMASPASAEILSPPTVNGTFITGGTTVDNGTCTTQNVAGTTGTATGTLTGLGALGTYNFTLTASIVRGTSSNTVWNQGVCFPSANTIRFQPTLAPTTSDGTNGPGYGNYEFAFNSAVGGLSFKINGLDNGDYAEVFAYNGATAVPVLASYITPSALLTAYTPLVNRFSGAATDANARGYFSPTTSAAQNMVVTFPTATNVSRIVVRFGKTGTSTGAATSLFSDFKWNVDTSITLTKALSGNRLTSTDQFAVGIRTGGGAGTLVSSSTNATSTGAGSTVTSGTGTTGAFVATSATSYTLTEVAAGTTILAQYASTISCTDSNSLQTGLPSGAAFTSGATAGAGLTIAPVAGAAISCVLTNSPRPTISLVKALGADRLSNSDQFTMAIRTGGVSGTVVNSTANSTTTGPNSNVNAGSGATGTYTATAGTAYTLTESASGTTNFSLYTSVINCTDSAGLQTGLPSGAAYNTATGLTITPVVGAVISCTLTNTPKTTSITLTKALGGNRSANTDQFTVAIRTGGVAGTVVNATTNSTTTGSTNAVTAGSGTTGTFTATPGTAYTLTETASGTTNFAQYTSTITCTDSSGLQTGLPSGAAYTVASGLTITPVVNAVISCTLTNTAKAPTLAMTKALGGNRVAATDQFTVALRTGGVTGTVVNATNNSTTTGATNVVTGGTGTTGTFTATAGTTYTLTEAASGTTNFAKYTSTITCTDSAGLQAGLPSGAAYTVVSGRTITPVAGAVISCTLTNTANNPVLTLAKSVVNTGGGTALASAWTLAASGPTNISGLTGVTAVTAVSVVAGAYTLSESGGPADINGGTADYNASTFSCVVNGGAAVSGNSIVLNLGDTTVCTITNTFVPDPKVTVDKRLLASTPTPLQANQVITYEFAVTNTGNVTLTGVNIDETAFNGSGAIGTFTPANGSVTLIPGASTNYTATYTVSQADVDLLQ